MRLQLARNLAALAVAALPTAGLSAAFVTIGPDAVLAGGGNGNGNGNGNGHGRDRDRDRSERGSSENRGNGRGHDADREHPGNGRGAVASELKGLNACHASAQARANAASNSQVGRIATYETAAAASQDARDDWQTAFDAFKSHEASYAGPNSADLQSRIDALDPASPTYATDLATLDAQRSTALNYETELSRLGRAANDQLAVVESAEAEQESALSAASGGRELSDEARAELDRCLEG